MQKRHFLGEETEPKTWKQDIEVKMGIPLLTDMCLALQSDHLGVIRVRRSSDLRLWTVNNLCFPDPLILAFQNSVIHVKFVSVLNGMALKWCE